MTPEEYFKKWAKNCRIFIDYKPIHDHADLLRFAEDYHQSKLKLLDIDSVFCECEAPLIRTGNNINGYCGSCGKNLKD